MAGNTYVYSNARHLFATGQINWVTGNVRCSLVSAAYAPSIGDVFYSAIPAGAIMADVKLTSQSETGGTCFGVIPEFASFTSATQVVALVLYFDTGNPASSPLLYYSDDGLGFPFQPQGFNYTVGFDQSAGGFFQA
jgi:hypothetical protein